MKVIQAVRAVFQPKVQCCWNIDPWKSHHYDSYCACCTGDCKKCGWLGYQEEGN